MPDLMDERAKRIGVTFLRNREIDPFPTATIDNAGMLEALFAITRPEEVRKPRLRELVAEALKKTPPPERVPLPKGMVYYKRERYGDLESPN